MTSITSMHVRVMVRPLTLAHLDFTLRRNSLELFKVGTHELWVAGLPAFCGPCVSPSQKG